MNRLPQPRGQVPIALLYHKDSKTQVALTSLSYSVEIIDSLAFISLHQTYKNENVNPIETEYFFSISPNSCFYEFVLQVKDKTIKAIIKEKEEAKQEYEAGLKKGHFGAYSEINPNLKDVMQLNIGNIPGDCEVNVKVSYLQQLDVYLNKFWKLHIPGVLTPRYRSEDLKQRADNFINNGKDYVSPFAKYPWDVKVSIKSSSEITFAESPTHALTVDYDQMRMVCNLQFKDKEVPNKDFVLFYRNKLINQGFLALEHLESDKKFPFCAMVSLVPEFNPEEPEKAFAKFKINPKENSFDVSVLESRAEFIVLLDRSGSMSGLRIEMAKEALIFFLKSMPPDSFFNICSFGSTYELLSPDSLKSNEKNINWAINEIQYFQANLGGTVIYEPLLKCFETKPMQQYPRTVFLITDGGVSDSDKVISLIAKYNKIYRTYSMGIGNGCSPYLIVESAVAGKGKYEFIENLNDLNEKVIYLLQDAITPYLSDCELEYDKNIVEIVSPMPNILRKNEALKLFFFMNEKFGVEQNSVFKVNFYDSILGKKVEKTFSIKPDDIIIKNDFLHKYGVFQTLAHMQRNFNYQLDVNSDIYLAQKVNLKEFCLEMSVKYQVLSEMTAFVCVLDEPLDPNMAGDKKPPQKVIVPNHQSVDYEDIFAGGGGGGFNALGGGNIKLCYTARMQTKSAAGCCGGGGGSYSSSTYEEPPAKKVVKKDENKELLMSVLQKQKTEGFWEFDINLLFKMNANKNILLEMEKKMKGKENVLMTLLVLLFLEKKQGTWKGTWVLIFNKAKEWLKQRENIVYPELEPIISPKIAEEIWK